MSETNTIRADTYIYAKLSSQLAVILIRERISVEKTFGGNRMVYPLHSVFATVTAKLAEPLTIALNADQAHLKMDPRHTAILLEFLLWSHRNHSSNAVWSPKVEPRHLFDKDAALYLDTLDRSIPLVKSILG